MERDTNAYWYKRMWGGKESENFYRIQSSLEEQEVQISHYRAFLDKLQFDDPPASQIPQQAPASQTPQQSPQAVPERASEEKIPEGVPQAVPEKAPASQTPKGASDSAKEELAKAAAAKAQLHGEMVAKAQSLLQAIGERDLLRVKAQLKSMVGSNVEKLSDSRLNLMLKEFEQIEAQLAKNHPAIFETAEKARLIQAPRSFAEAVGNVAEVGINAAKEVAQKLINEIKEKNKAAEATAQKTQQTMQQVNRKLDTARSRIRKEANEARRQLDAASREVKLENYSEQVRSQKLIQFDQLRKTLDLYINEISNITQSYEDLSKKIGISNDNILSMIDRVTPWAESAANRGDKEAFGRYEAFLETLYSYLTKYQELGHALNQAVEALNWDNIQASYDALLKLHDEMTTELANPATAKTKVR
jgi:hypothetical protein